MREARIISVTKKNRKLSIIRDILTRKIRKMFLREGTSSRDEEMEVPSTKKVDWYEPDSGNHIYIPVSKINTCKPVNTKSGPQTNTNIQDKEEFIEVIKPKRVMSRPNSPGTLTSPSVAKRYKVDHNTPIKLKNGFEPLIDQKPNHETYDITNENTKIANNIPPIYLSADNFQEIIKDLNLITTSIDF
jgi:hypothetical protein